MSNLEFPEGYISKYRSGEKVFKYSDMFIDTYILFIIDYFYIINVNISEILILNFKPISLAYPIFMKQFKNVHQNQ